MWLINVTGATDKHICARPRIGSVTLAWVAACSPSAVSRASVHVIAVCLPARRRFQLEITEVDRLSSWLLAILYCDDCFSGGNRMLLLRPCAAFLVSMHTSPGSLSLCPFFAYVITLFPLPCPSSMSVTSLEDELQASIQRSHPELRRVYFNKGLWSHDQALEAPAIFCEPPEATAVRKSRVTGTSSYKSL